MYEWSSSTHASSMLEMIFEFKGNALLGKLQAQDASPPQQMDPLWASELITSRFSVIQSQKLSQHHWQPNCQLPFHHNIHN
jgi:hypothetical protein